MVGGTEHQPCNVRHDKPDEANRTAKGGDNGSKHAGDKQQQVARQADIDTEVFGIAASSNALSGLISSCDAISPTATTEA